MRLTGRRNKFNNVKTKIGEIPFHSKKEARRWQELLLLEKAGKIFNLCRQVPYILCESVVIGGRKHPSIKYVADFVYDTKTIDGLEIYTKTVVEDAKGFRDRVYLMKRHLFKAKYRFDILET